jgi:hypothetical protein
MTYGDFSTATQPRGMAATPGARTRPGLPSGAYQSQATSVAGAGGVNMTAQVQTSGDQGNTNLVLQPVFQTVINNRPTMNLPLIPGGGPAR